MCHFAVSSSFSDKPVKSEDLPVLLGNEPVVQDSQSHDFEVLCLVVVLQHVS